jgi:hypothetical protein
MKNTIKVIKEMFPPESPVSSIEKIENLLEVDCEQLGGILRLAGLQINTPITELIVGILDAYIARKGDLTIREVHKIIEDIKGNKGS